MPVMACKPFRLPENSFFGRFKVFKMITGLFLGALFGFVLQRGRFCITGAFRDLYIQKSGKYFIALLIAITVQAIGFFALKGLGIISVEPAENLALGAVLIGAFIFGIGIVLAGGCATGTWYRAGEGLVGSWLALLVYIAFSALMRTGSFAAFNQSLRSQTVEHSTIYGSLGVSPWVLIVVLAVVTGFLAYRHLSRPRAKIATLPAKRTGIAHILFEKRWHPFVTAILVGLIAIAAWPLSLATGRAFGLGITAPSANILQFLLTGKTQYINWGVFLVLGILVGSFIAAKLSSEFRIRIPNTKTLIYSGFGGALMGVGATLAGGCSIGNGLVETAFFSWQGWVSLPVMILGTWVASYFTIVLPRKTAFRQPEQASVSVIAK